MMGEMSDFRRAMNSLSDINNSDSRHGNKVISNSNDGNNVSNGSDNLGKETGIHNNCAKQQQQSVCDNGQVAMETAINTTNVTETAVLPCSGGAIFKKKVNRPDHLGSVPFITAVEYSDASSDRHNRSDMINRSDRNNRERSDRKSKEIETWLMDVPVGGGENQHIDCRNKVNTHPIDGGPDRPENADLVEKTLNQHEKENPEIQSVEGGNTESACSSFPSNCSNAPSDGHYVRGRTASRREARLRKQSCPNFKDRPASELDNEEKVDDSSTYSGQSLMPVTGDSSKGMRKLSGPDKAFSRGLRVDLRRVNENGRLIFYFKSPERPRSLSPNYRLASDGASRMSIGQDSCSEIIMTSRKSSDVTSRKSSDVTSRKSSAQSSIFSPSPNEKLRAGVAALRDLYKEHYAMYSGRPWSAGAAK